MGFKIFNFRHLATKITLLLVVVVLTVMGFISISSTRLLQKENQAYTLQSQALQNQLIGKEFSSLLGMMSLEVNRYHDAQVRKIYDLSSPHLRAIFLFGVHKESEDIQVLSQHGLSDSQLEMIRNWSKGAFSKTQKPKNTLGRAIPLRFDLVKENREFALMICQEGTPNTDFQIECSAGVVQAQRLSADMLSTDGQVANLFGENVLDSNPDRFSKQVNFFKSPIYEMAKKSGIQNGSLEFDDLDGSAVIGSFYRLDSGLLIFSKTKYRDAIRPTLILITKLFLVMIFSVGFALLASVWFSRRLSNPLETLTSATESIAGGNFDQNLQIHSSDEIGTLAGSVERMANQIKKLLNEVVEKTKLEGELEVAATVQKTLIPPTQIQWENLSIQSWYQPAEKCGGDWWGMVRGHGKIAFFVGDVTGHGYPSALVVATGRGCLAVLQRLVDSDPNYPFDPSEMMRFMNRSVFEAANGELNMTAVCLVLDLKTGDLRYANAAHNPLYIVSAENEGDVRSLMNRGERLGENQEVGDYKVKSETLREGEKLVMFTDGVWDLGSGEKAVGKKGFQNFLLKENKKDGKALIETARIELMKDQVGPLLDDVTFVVVERVAEVKPELVPGEPEQKGDHHETEVLA